MYLGKDFETAKRQARANAKSTGKPWVLWMYGTVWYAEHESSFMARYPDGSMMIFPEEHRPCRGDMECIRQGRCPHDPVCNN